MNILKDFIKLLSGNFNNKDQYEEMQKKGIAYPFAEHRNNVCNDKFINIPDDFKGIFLLEESYYTTNGKKHASPHLFLFTEVKEGIKLSSYDMPKGYNNDTFTYENLGTIDFHSLKESQKFTPAIYKEKDGIWEGGSVSMFSPVLKFTLFERFSKDCLEVSEIMEVNGKRTFGYDDPIIYKRI